MHSLSTAGKTQDIQRASKLLETAKRDIAEIRGSFEEIVNEAADLARGWGFDSSLNNHRIRKVKKHFDELSYDERLSNAKENFHVSVLDVIISQFENRFKGLNSVVQIFEVLFPSSLRDHSDADLVLLSENPIKFYSNDLSDSLPQELFSFRRIYKDQINADISINNLAKLVIYDQMISSSFREVCCVFIPFLTIPVSVAISERSFSIIKLIKNYLRNKMSQSRFSSLAILSIENETARTLDLNKIISLFANQKTK